VTRTLIAATLFLTGLALTSTAQPPVQPNEPPVTDPKVIPPPVEGGYTIAAVERDGKSRPPSEFKDAIVRVTGGRVVGTDRDRTELLVASYTLNTAKTPWAIEMKLYGDKGETLSGLVKKENNVLTIIYALPGGEAPKEFKTKANQQMFVLRAFVLDPLPPPNKFSNSP
jgi:uncharacterized protein (TIGR03067 family)